MAKRKTRKKKTASRAQKRNISLEEREIRLARAIEQQHYKQALSEIRQLLNIEKRPEWLQQAQELYEKQAQHLADIGNYLAAINAWEQGMAQHRLSAFDKRYLDWLSKDKRYTILLKRYQELQAASENHAKDIKWIQSRLAAIILSGQKSLLGALDQTDLLLNDYSNAQYALESWCQGDTAKNNARTDKYLKKIGFRSPYRDLRQIIQAALMINESPEQALTLLKRIPVDSGFYPLAEQIELAVLPQATLMKRLAPLSASKKQCAWQFQGWTKKDVGLIRKLDKLPDTFEAEELCRCIPSLSHYFTKENKPYLREYAKKATATNTKYSLKPLEKVFGKFSVSEYNFVLMHQTHLDKEKSFAEFEERGHDYIQTLKIAAAKQPSASTTLKQALLYRLLAKERVRYNEEPDAIALGYLTDALELDPKDEQAWQELLKYCLQIKDLKTARKHIQTALTHYPASLPIMELAIQVAIAGGAFKKAANYAKKILKADPINARVKQYLQNAHIAHARKQIKLQKWHLAFKELRDAEAWTNDDNSLQRDIIQVLDVLSTLAQNAKTQAQRKKQAKPLLEPLQQQLESHLQLIFMIHYEARLSKQDERALLKATQNKRLENRPQKQDILSLIKLAYAYRKLDQSFDTTKLAIQAMNNSLGYLPAYRACDAKEAERICEFLFDIEHKDLLPKIAETFEIQFPEKPVFVYYQYVFLSLRQFDEEIMFELEEALEDAQELGDSKLVMRILKLLESIVAQIQPTSPFDFLLDEDDEDDFYDDSEDRDNEMRKHMLGMIHMMDVESILGLMSMFWGEQMAERIFRKHGESTARNLCERILGGEDPERVLKSIGEKPPRSKGNPFFGGLF